MTDENISLASNLTWTGGDVYWPEKPGWMADGACLGLDPNVFFSDDLGPARRICAGCPVRVECLEYGLDNYEAGMWGGTTEKERRNMRRERGTERRPVPITHGTTTGYNRGCRLACCRAANTEAKRLRGDRPTVAQVAS